MNWKTSIFLSTILVFISCKEMSKDATIDLNKEIAIESITYVNTDHIIEANELKDLMGIPNIKIVHFGREKQYKEGHIKSAINIWRTDIEDASYPYKGMMCSKSQLEKLFSSRGIRNEDTLIIYDHVASCDAARLWWILENYGFHNVRILNGGINGWNDIDGKLTTEITPIKESNFTLPDVSPMTFYVNKEQVLSAVNDKTPPLILDTRTVNEYTGVRQKKGANSGGRIPGSILMNWADCVNYESDKKFKDYIALATMYDSIIPNKEQLVIAYCHSGVRSAHTTFVLTELLGYKNVKNYDGSWTEWSQFENYPKKKDSITTILK
ncbi:rhodanese-like domain-containing protein [Dokdonia sp.]|uniref:sulfurtransferase n=1 Tax=Dokdonia sp. TaxID=2024995 RepID=UPI00326580BB